MLACYIQQFVADPWSALGCPTDGASFHVIPNERLVSPNERLVSFRQGGIAHRVSRQVFVEFVLSLRH